MLLLHNNIYLGGTSDTNGTIKYSNNWEGKVVRLHKMGFIDTIINLKDGSIYSIRTKEYKIPRVEINSSVYSPYEHIKRFINYNSTLMKSERDTLFFNFKYQIDVAEKKWKEQRTGKLMIVYNPYHKKNTKVWNSEYCKINVEVDSSFWFSQIRDELVKGVLIGIFEKDGMRKKRLLRSKLKKEYKVSNISTEKGYEFEISSKGDQEKDNHYSKVGFNMDSTIAFYSYRWLTRDGEQVNAGLKNAKHNAHYSYWRYTKKRPITVDSIHSIVGFVSKNGISHQVDFRAKRVYSNEQTECLGISMFLEFMPKSFKRRDIEDHVTFFD